MEVGMVKASALAALRLSTSSNVLGLLHRQVGRFGTIENAPDVASHFAIRSAKALP